MFTSLREHIIGQGMVLAGPFGPRRMFYADYVASGRAYAPIEDTIRDTVLPLYANTHTESTLTGRQTTAFREQARQIIARTIGANDEDAVLFCGTGCTGAIDKLINILRLKLPQGIGKYGVDTDICETKRPVVFIGPFEHHSNDVQWRETIADVVTIKECADGALDMDDLETQLQKYTDRPLMIGSFSAASNVTGILCDPVPVAKLLHKYGAFAAFDFAAAAPYMRINMNTDDEAYFDAIFISVHKYLGGPNTPGILALKKKWAQNKTPVIPGGGTVSYVSPCAQSYLECIEHREEGGTPDIVGAIRAGLCFQLQNEVGVDVIETKELAFAKHALARWGQNENIKILGSETAERLPVFSFLIKCGERYLHYNFVVALLNDVFGIQARGGCSCAGPYGHRLLDIGLDVSREYESVIASGVEILKPGWVRVGFNYFYNDADCELLLRAVEWIADKGAKLLPYYNFNSETGRWVHKDAQDTLMDLSNISNVYAGTPPKDMEAVFSAADKLTEACCVGNESLCCPMLESAPEHLHWFAH